MGYSAFGKILCLVKEALYMNLSIKHVFILHAKMPL